MPIGPIASNTVNWPGEFTPPRVSIVLPVHNGAATLDRAIRSVVDRTCLER